MANRQEWLDRRKLSIGGSDAAAIVGMNPYRTAFAVWQDKTSAERPQEIVSEAMRQGTDLESYVACRFASETGKKVRAVSDTLSNPAYPFAHANIDRRIVGEKALLECKTTSGLNMKRFRNGEYPEEYYVQCMHYLAVTGFEKAYLAVLIFGKDFKIFEIERDEAEIDALMDTERVFWDNCVVRRQPPCPKDYKISLDEVNDFYAVAEDKVIVDLTEVEEDIRQLQEYKKLKKELDGRIEDCETRIKAYMKTAESGTCADYKVSWKNYQTAVFDYKAYMADNSSLDFSNYYRSRNSRRFTVSARGEI